jgi:hypothetical protein
MGPLDIRSIGSTRKCPLGLLRRFEAWARIVQSKRGQVNKKLKLIRSKKVKRNDAFIFHCVLRTEYVHLQKKRIVLAIQKLGSNADN